MALYRAVRNLLEMGATAGQARRAFELAVTSRRPWDLAVFDDFERETNPQHRSEAPADRRSPASGVWRARRKRMTARVSVAAGSDEGVD
jgi:hypothetical protein